MSKKEQISTFQTRLIIDKESEETLTECTDLLSHVERCLFAKVASGKHPKECKNEFLKKFQITARQFNAIRVCLEGKIDSYRKVNVLRIEVLEDEIKKLEIDICKWEKKRLKKKVHGKKLRLARLKRKQEKLQKDQAENKLRICFGKRKAFRKQFLPEVNHAEWKSDWQFERNREFFTLGSKDETGGNQTCTAFIQEDGSLTLRLRIPDALGKGKYLYFSNIRFAYGHDVLLLNLKSCELRKELLKEKTPNFSQHGQAISFRFFKDEKGWRVFASTTLPKPNWITEQKFGTLGVDINVDHLAITETDHFGNSVYTESIPLNLYGKNKNQARAEIGNACRTIVEIAAKVKKPILIEKLNFSKKRNALREYSPKLARMLSAFDYSAIIQTLHSRAYRCNVQVFEVNPAYTSLVGKIKYAKQYGMTIHQAAALCIARRLSQFSERLPKSSSIPDGKGGHISFFVPVRNRKKNEWSYFAVVAKKLKAAHVEHFRAANRRSKDPPQVGLCDENSSNFGGAIPSCESLASVL